MRAVVLQRETERDSAMSPEIKKSSTLRQRSLPQNAATVVDTSLSSSSSSSSSCSPENSLQSVEGFVVQKDSNRNGENSELNKESAIENDNHVRTDNESMHNGDHVGPSSISVSHGYRAAAPAHRRVKESPLSSDAIFKQSHAGLFNLCIVVLIAVNSRLIIENLMKYGLLIRAGFWFSSRSLRDWPLLMCCLTLPVFPLAAFVVERLVQHKFISESIVVLLHVIITTSEVLYPIFVILRCDSAVLSGLALMLFTSIIWLKLVSYAHTNYDLRTLAESENKGDGSLTTKLENPQNITLKNMAYFIVAPTLCYQPSYPRTAFIRKGWIIRQLIKLVIFTGLMGFIIEQYINPIVKNSQHPLKGNFLYAMERVLKLSVPTLYVWLCMFYCLFHLWLNILAELLRFGDREFYKDWWNAKTIEEYWRMWNMPVHKWMVRHVYLPCLRNGIPKVTFCPPFCSLFLLILICPLLTNFSRIRIFYFVFLALFAMLYFKASSIDSYFQLKSLDSLPYEITGMWKSLVLKLLGHQGLYVIEVTYCSSLPNIRTSNFFFEDFNSIKTSILPLDLKIYV